MHVEWEGPFEHAYDGVVAGLGQGGLWDNLFDKIDEYLKQSRCELIDTLEALQEFRRLVDCSTALPHYVGINECFEIELVQDKLTKFTICPD